MILDLFMRLKDYSRDDPQGMVINFFFLSPSSARSFSVVKESQLSRDYTSIN